ncbi:adenine-specific methyltransferase EcoRI family protein (plasmid) [Rhodococcus antarcticus]|uniref:Adenine-specific methyltransferase EcoRI family protein n=1 Tax=Rhodococcus antarcticus TaxID=2987751 RepID=A0ABY6P6J6_9NOCA|nr:adenine-specific methyltransferase EcoRI family protein [Rhodococcus antarcticus]UZJ26906.1 adenine-specific methyltransferase EcoRI family protein [Rhodococcus antarcticus]
MTTGAGNEILGRAKAVKNDEFYTQWADIEREMNAYLEYDPNVFRDKVVLLPCDDPEWSNFTKFFALRFMDYGIKRLISTSFAPDSNPAGDLLTPTLFETEDPKFDSRRTRLNGKKFVLEPKDLNKDGVVNIDDLQWDYLEGDGDFRSAEVTALRDGADIVITNPPFSLFREFVDWLVEGRVRFSMIGNQNAIAYREVFRRIKDNQMWLGKGFPRNMAHFHTPYSVHSPWVEQRGEGIVRVPGVQWFTNIEHGRRHEPLQLMTMTDNLRYNKKLIGTLGGGTEYQRYDNFDAIEVPFSDAIPSDFDGVMGVPITWLAKYNPDQFEILGTDESDLRPTKTYSAKRKFVDGVLAKSNTGSKGCYIRADSFGAGTYFDVGYPVKRMYKRIFIQRKTG